MTKNDGNHESGQLTQNQNNKMSDDPADGGRRPEGAEGKDAPNEKPRDQKAPSLEEFGARGEGPR